MSKIQVVRAIGFLTTFSVAGAISQPRQSCQFLFCLMKIHCCTGPLGRRADGRQAKGFLWRRSVELRASGAVGLRWQAAFRLSDCLGETILPGDAWAARAGWI